MVDRRTTSRHAVIAAAVAGCALLSACGSSSNATPNAPTPTAKPTANATPTATPIATPRPMPDAHQLTFQTADIPAGFAPHPGSIMTLDAKTSVSENLVSDGGVLATNGYISGAEYGWEDKSKHLAVQNAVFVMRDANGAQALFDAMSNTFKPHISPNADSPHWADSTASFASSNVSVVLFRQGTIVAAVESTPASPDQAADLAKKLDDRYVAQFGS
jgi:hypothetical protein